MPAHVLVVDLRLNKLETGFPPAAHSRGGVAVTTSRGFQKCVLSFVREKCYCCLDCLRAWVRRSERRVLQARGTVCKDLER